MKDTYVPGVSYPTRVSPSHIPATCHLAFVNTTNCPIGLAWKVFDKIPHCKSSYPRCPDSFFTKMMNLLALALLISSLAAAGVLSPSPQSNSQTPNPLLHEGHRVIVVEYERQIPSISSPPASGDVTDDSKNKFPESTSAISHTPKEKICDAYGVCKDKVSSFLTKTKQTAAQLEKSAAEAVKTAAETAKEKTTETIKSATEKVIDAGVDVTANISAAARKAVDQAEEASVELRRNLTEILRRARELWRDAAVFVGVGASKAVRPVATVGHLLGFATAYGTCVWVTFASSHVLASALPREQFGMVQSRLYPVYFRAVAFGLGASAVALFFGSWRRSAVERVQVYNLLATLGVVVVNLLFLEPKATQAMFERMKLEKEEGMGRDMDDGGSEPVTMVTSVDLGQVADSMMARASKRLKKMNTHSSFLNILALMGLSWHLVYLSQRLESSC